MRILLHQLLSGVLLSSPRGSRTYGPNPAPSVRGTECGPSLARYLYPGARGIERTGAKFPNHPSFRTQAFGSPSGTEDERCIPKESDFFRESEDRTTFGSKDSTVPEPHPGSKQDFGEKHAHGQKPAFGFSSEFASPGSIFEQYAKESRPGPPRQHEKRPVVVVTGTRQPGIRAFVVQTQSQCEPLF